MGRGVMTLIAIARIRRDRKPRPVGNIGISEGVGMFAARAMAIFALDIGKILKGRRHRRPVPIGQDRWKDPTICEGDVVEPVIVGIGSCVIADGMTLEARLAVMTQETVDALGEDFGVGSVLPRVNPILGDTIG